MKERDRFILISPSLEECVRTVKEGVEKHFTIIIVGSCWVEYRGRASSKLKPGERILIIKEDGTLLIHRPIGYEPVNWMPGGDIIYHVQMNRQDAQRKRKEKEYEEDYELGNIECPSAMRPFRAYVNGDYLIVKAVKRSPRETVIIYFDQIHFLSTFKLIDEGEFSLYASEEDMQKAILLNPSIIEDGFIPIEYEKKVQPGFVDVYGVDGEGRMVVIEIKRKTARKDAVMQLARYVESVKTSAGREIRGILAAPQISREAWRLLTSFGLDFKRIDPKKCSMMLRKAEDRKILDFLRTE